MEVKTSAKQTEERKKLDLTIGIEDFGPISSGEITLRPLTVFIGPNNSGKSYAAMLIHSVFESYGAYDERVASRKMPYFISVNFDTPSREIPGLKKQFDDLKEGEELDIHRESIETIVNKISQAIYEQGLSSEIGRSFACSLRELVRIGGSSFKLNIKNGPRYSIHLICGEDELRFKEYPQLDISMKLKATGGPSHAIKITVLGNPDHANGYELSSAEVHTLPGTDRNLLFPALVSALSHLCTAELLRGAATLCHYLPAGKSHLLQIYKAFASSVMKELARPDTKEAKIPRISGVVSGFISSVIDLPAEEGVFYQLVRDFEEKLISGEIVVSAANELLLPEFKYIFRDAEMPLYRASSAVSELAPLFLYLKHKVNRYDVLIIEEPEAHLHPANQRILARLLVRLVREGVHVIITTHSEYLLEQLRNFILLSKIEPEKRSEKYKYTEKDFLYPDDFAAYVFHYDAESAGHKIDKLEITEDGEISQDEFGKVIDALYEETIKLRIDLSDEA